MLTWLLIDWLFVNTSSQLLLDIKASVRCLDSRGCKRYQNAQAADWEEEAKGYGLRYSLSLKLQIYRLVSEGVKSVAKDQNVSTNGGEICKQTEGPVKLNVNIRHQHFFSWQRQLNFSNLGLFQIKKFKFVRTVLNLMKFKNVVVAYFTIILFKVPWEGRTCH